MIDVAPTGLDGVVVVTPRVFADSRGFFMESFNARDAEEHGLPTVYVQDNHSFSKRGVLRGLHFQFPAWQDKLVRAVTGEIYDVAVDIRPDSPSYGEWVGVTLSADNGHQLFVPRGFAHGFCVVSEEAHVMYKCTALYAPADDRCIRWDDPDIGIDWPVEQPSVSDKDEQGRPFAELGALWREPLAGAS